MVTRTEQDQHTTPPFAEGTSRPLGSSDMIRTGGEKLFDTVTYRGVDWLVNSAVAVAFAYWANRTERGINGFQKPVTKFYRNIVKVFEKDAQKIEERAKWGSLFTSIMVGGFTTIPPIMALEANKNRIVQYFDRKIYGEERVKNDPIFQQAYEEIANEPAQDFKAGMIARLFALTPMITLMMTFPRKLERFVYEPIARCTKWIARHIGLEPQWMHTRMLPAEDGHLVSDWDYVHQKIGADVGLTFFYSILHEHAYKAMADYYGKPSEPSVKPEEYTHKKEDKAAPKPEAKPEPHVAAHSLRYDAVAAAAPPQIGHPV